MTDRVPGMVVHRGVAGYKGDVETFDPLAPPEPQEAGPAWVADGYVPPSGSAPALASQAEMEAGTEPGIRSVSPLRVAQAIEALATGGGGNARLVDLGVINAVDLIGAPLDLNLAIGAAAGDFVAIIVAADNYVSHDSDDDIYLPMYGISENQFLLDWGAGGSAAQTIANSAQYPGIISDGGSLLMSVPGSDPTVGSIHLYALVVGSGEAGPGGSDFPLTADVDADGFTIKNLADPVDDGDAANKTYVDDKAALAVALLADPGNAWEAETAVVEGYRITVEPGWVFEVGISGTTDTDAPDWGSVAPLQQIADGDAAWTFIGYVGQVQFDALDKVVPALAAAGGGARLVDFGVINIADLMAGPVTLYEPAAGELVRIEVGLADFVPLVDAGISTIYVTRGDLTVDLQEFLVLDQDVATAFDLMNSGAGYREIVSDGSPVVVGLPNPGLTAFAPSPVTEAWQANHAYLIFLDPAAVYIEAEGHLWTANQGGTSDATPPDFAGNIGGSVTDNDITWGDNGVVPAVGSIHLYALVAKSVAP